MTMYGLLILGLVISLLASWNVNATFRRYQTVSNGRGYTAGQVARQILDQNGLYQVSIERVSGNLTDHFDPKSNVVRLSDSVYQSTSVAAIGVAAHECGHAVQHAVGYVPIKVRNAFVPVAQIGSYAWYFIFIAGLIFGLNTSLGNTLAYAGILLFSAVVLFQVLTLPVEFNASRRALQTLQSNYILDGDEIGKARKVLVAAAMTYVAAMVNAILQLLRLLSIVGRRRD